MTTSAVALLEPLARAAPTRTVAADGSKVITDPVQLGPYLLHALVESGGVCHGNDGNYRRRASRCALYTSAGTEATTKKARSWPVLTSVPQSCRSESHS